jgi:hypothetical protein
MIRLKLDLLAADDSSHAQLAGGQTLRLITPFEPLPLFSVLAKKGFQHTSRQIEQGAGKYCSSAQRLRRQRLQLRPT